MMPIHVCTSWRWVTDNTRSISLSVNLFIVTFVRSDMLKQVAFNTIAKALTSALKFFVSPFLQNMWLPPSDSNNCCQLRQDTICRWKSSYTYIFQDNYEERTSQQISCIKYIDGCRDGTDSSSQVQLAIWGQLSSVRKKSSDFQGPRNHLSETSYGSLVCLDISASCSVNTCSLSVQAVHLSGENRR